MTRTALITCPPPALTPGCGHPAHSASRPVRTAEGALVVTVATSGPGRRLVDEWASVAASGRNIREAESWGIVAYPLVSLDDLLLAAGFAQAPDDSDGDHILWHLVTRAANDPLAARIVLQRLLPALFAIAKRRGRIVPGGVGVALDDVLASAWQVITTFPHDRRAVKVAANIARDTEYMAFVRPARLRRVTEVSADPATMRFGAADPDGEDEGVGVVLDEAAALGVDAGRIALLRRLAAGHTSEMIAEEAGCSPRTIRNRRRAAIEDVRRALEVC